MAERKARAAERVAVAIVGAGAMGRLFGARLLLSGHDVLFIDVSDAAREAMNTHGITVVTDGSAEHTPASASAAEDVTSIQDLVFVFTKGFHTRAALESIRHLVGPSTVAVTVQNGLGNAEALETCFRPERIVRGVTTVPADLVAPSTVLTTRDGAVRLGGPVPAAGEVAALLADAGLDASVAADLEAVVWEKLAFNAALNTVGALTGMTNGQIAGEPRARSLVDDIIREVVAVASVRGIALTAEQVREAVEIAYVHHPEHKASMLQDVEAGRRTEIDSIAGEVVREAETRGMPAPVLSTVWRLIGCLSPEPLERTR